MLLWETENITKDPWHKVSRVQSVGSEISFDISKIGSTGPFGAAAYLQAHLPSTYQEHDHVKRVCSERSSPVIEELSCFSPVRWCSVPVWELC